MARRKTVVAGAVAIAASLPLIFGNVALARHAKHPRATPRPSPVAEAWPELKSDLPPDPLTQFGALSNGMRYAIKNNLTPPGEVSVRLRIAAGSLSETPDEAGIAHLIEHMTFRGTTHIPDGAAIKELEGLGLRMGADINAFTQPTETYFTFDLPRNDAATIDKVLVLLREMASEAQFNADALDSERQVVLAEKRTRDSPVLHIRMAEEKLVLGDATGSLMTPIGDEDVITHATSAQLRSFYDSHYRPENATLIVVGDVDSKSVESAIRKTFADWRGKGVPAQRQPAATASANGARIAIVTEPDAPRAVLYSWVKPRDASADSHARDRKNLVDLIGLTIFNFRLAKLAADRDVPIVTALVSHTRSRALPDIHQFSVTYGAKGAVAAMQAASAALAKILKEGVTQAELDRACADLQSIFDAAATAGPTTPSHALADTLLRSVDDEVSFLTPEQSAALYRSEMQGLSVGEVSTSLREAFSGQGPFVLVSGREAPTGGAKAIADALAAAPQADTSSVVESAPLATSQWPYASFGPAGTVASRQDAADLGVTLVTFANGVNATIKPTPFRSGDVLIAISFGHGRLGLPKDRAVPVWALPATFPLGGLKLATFDELSARFEAQFVDVRFRTRDDAFELAGNTKTKDFDTELQLLTAYISDPAWRSDAFDKARALELLGAGHAQGTPDGVLSRNTSALLHDGDPRWNVPDLRQIADADLSQTRAIVSKALKGPLEVTVVGDIGVDKTLQSLSATLGALPLRAPDARTVEGDERFARSRAEPLVLHHEGSVSQAAAAIDWQTIGAYPNPQQSLDVRVLEEVLLHRLYDELRIKDGIAYSPQASVESSLMTPGFGYLSAVADIPPEKIDAFYAAVSHVVDDLKAQPVGDDELARARDPRVNDVVREQQTNEYWLNALVGVHSDPKRLDAIRATVAGLKGVTAKDVQSAAQAYLRDDRAFKVIVVPKDFVQH